MFATFRFRRAATMALVASAALLGSAGAFAQQRQIDVRWTPSVGLGTSFTFELTQRSDGRLSGAWVPMEPGVRTQGQRSTLRSQASELDVRMNYGALVQQKSSTGTLMPRGLLGVQVDARSRPAGGGDGGDIIVFDIIDSATRQQPAGGGGGGDIIVFDIVDSVVPVVTRIRIDARPGQQLEGDPAHWAWFNRPGPGEPLIATVPTPMPGQALRQTIEIRDVLAPTSTPLKVGLAYVF